METPADVFDDVVGDLHTPTSLYPGRYEPNGSARGVEGPYRQGDRPA